jgi:hypothetical protein
LVPIPKFPDPLLIKIERLVVSKLEMSAMDASKTIHPSSADPRVFPDEKIYVSILE